MDATRRRLLAAAAAAGAGALAGCADEQPADTSADSGTPTDDGTPTGGDGPADGDAGTPTGTAAPSTTASGLDLREANVTGVEVGGSSGDVRFSVTLYHDDDGEDGYANWWQVETLDGTRLGRRDLAHPHGTREFTRSATVSVPDGVTCVVVRGHDQTHGYGGQAMLVGLADGATTAVRQGRETQSFAEGDCP